MKSKEFRYKSMSRSTRHDISYETSGKYDINEIHIYIQIWFWL